MGVTIYGNSSSTQKSCLRPKFYIYNFFLFVWLNLSLQMAQIMMLQFFLPKLFSVRCLVARQSKAYTPVSEHFSCYFRLDESAEADGTTSQIGGCPMETDDGKWGGCMFDSDEDMHWDMPYDQ